MVSDDLILAITSADDPTTDAVARAARRRGVEFSRLNAEDFPSRLSISIDATGGYAGVNTDGRTISLGRARGVLVRRLAVPRVPSSISDIDAKLAYHESVSALGGILRTLASRCVSDPDAMQAARWKVPQLRAAKSLGFAVPPTLVTNNRGDASRFLAQGPAVAKAISEAYVRSGANEMAGATHEVSVEPTANQLALAPVLLQRAITKAADWRVTVVGDEIFSVRIVAPRGAPIDIRDTNPADCSYQVRTLDQATNDRIRMYRRHWGLQYLAMDFAEDEDGIPWFLEGNPAGQWMWIESLTGLQISDSVLGLMLTGLRP